ncbi:hypothetical protein C8A01DRAFT_33659 [Parachaetomium inaequale]|uniref:Shugoshin n=1 Tax=Parachaetomium inaequale TaxID=2588326 RepID=A0AAN6PPM8_9PEZI|nr:hypothetical protein C8A01DRAFT_33659 [Parachaetomium inaequale]
MARLNEAPAPPESHLEILRRKFLRQNRDIAKINSDQSQKIRRLENDCASLLSENLDLRGQILRLEKQIEDNSARRIADHALEVKAKLEVQLSEFTALLGTLGVEPPAKRRSSGDRILSKPRQSMARSPPQRRRRGTSIDSEALAEMEGRLPPIYENKTYPRATMSSEEIMALCAAAEDTNDSSDLGPPPVSQFVEEEPVKHSPARAIEEIVPESPRQPRTLSSPPKLFYDREPSRSPQPKEELGEIVVELVSEDGCLRKKPAPLPAPQPVRVGSKRKYGDENGTIQSITAPAGRENAIPAPKKFPSRVGQKRRSLVDLARAEPEKKGARVPLSAKRTPLAAKSTNEDVSSPRKVMKAAPSKAGKKEQSQGPEDSVMKDEANRPGSPVEIVVSVDPVLLESATALPSATPSSPTTPPRPAQQEMLHDTPPPADISSTGETTRPSRRARASVSYAEPNLRDKMRRPTKELFDAVTGEGKYAQRATAKSDDHHSAPASVSKFKSELGSSTSSSSKTTVCDPTMAQQQALLSPLAQKDVFPETLPSTVVMERRKRPSAAHSSRESLAALERSDNTNREPSPATTAPPQEAALQTSSNRHKTSVPKPEKTSNQQHPPPPPPTEADIYDFAASSPSTSSKAPPTPDTSSEFLLPTTTSHSTTTGGSRPRPRTARKSSMAAAAALREMLDDDEKEEEHDNRRHVNPPPPPLGSRSSRAAARAHAGGRKRASMLAPKKSSMLEALEGSSEVVDADTSGSSAEGDGAVGSGSGREGRVARRRSMML